jgi:hypothetical protein
MKALRVMTFPIQKPSIAAAKAPNRRTALSLMSAGAMISAFGAPAGAREAAPHRRPVLATPEQIKAELALLRLLADPALEAAQARVKAELAATPKGQTPDGAVRIDAAVDEWTASVIFKEIASYRPTPAILWTTDDTPRTWLGHTLGGVGTAGDNPDNIYRSAYVDGAGRYEILGQVDPLHRPAQFSLEIVRGEGALPSNPKTQSSNRADMGNQVAMITDRDLEIAPDGTFRIRLGGDATGRGAVALPPGPLTFGFRDTLSDWSQRPNRLTLRRLDPAPPRPFDPAELRRRALDGVEPYVRFWSKFTDGWFGGLKPNTVGGPVARDGGWGFVAGVRFQLAPDEALVITTTRGGAAYTGFQLVDPWLIAPDARRHQVCLNLSQATPNQDGAYTYVITGADPGVANWLDTTGLGAGYGVVRWQGLAPGATREGLLGEARLVKRAEVADLQGVARVTPAERRVQLAARVEGYTNRLL